MNLREEINKAKIDALYGGSWDDFEEAAIEIAEKYAKEMCEKQIISNVAEATSKDHKILKVIVNRLVNGEQ